MTDHRNQTTEWSSSPIQLLQYYEYVSPPCSASAALLNPYTDNRVCVVCGTLLTVPTISFRYHAVISDSLQHPMARSKGRVEACIRWRRNETERRERNDLKIMCLGCWAEESGTISDCQGGKQSACYVDSVVIKQVLNTRIQSKLNCFLTAFVRQISPP